MILIEYYTRKGELKNTPLLVDDFNKLCYIAPDEDYLITNFFCRWGNWGSNDYIVFESLFKCFISDKEALFYDKSYGIFTFVKEDWFRPAYSKAEFMLAKSLLPYIVQDIKPTNELIDPYKDYQHYTDDPENDDVFVSFWNEYFSTYYNLGYQMAQFLNDSDMSMDFETFIDSSVFDDPRFLQFDKSSMFLKLYNDPKFKRYKFFIYEVKRGFSAINP